MLTCPDCKIMIRGRRKTCPLCGAALTGAPEEDVFPAIPKKKLTGRAAVKISFLALVIAEVFFLIAGPVAEKSLHHPLPWLPLVMILCLVGWLDLVFALYLRNNLLKTVTVESYMAMLAAYAVDRNTGFFGWSLSWMIPMTFAALAITTFAIVRYRKMRIEDYAVYLIFDTVICMLQVIPVLSGENHFILPALQCMIVNLLVITAVLILRHRDVGSAARKYFNV